jgi:long-subunit fatty acid transport protein
MRILFVILASLLTVLVAVDGSLAQGVITKRGTTAAPFLEVGVGARAVAMGESFVALANDVSSMYWNPAGLAAMNRSEGIFAHTEWIADIGLDYAALALNLGEGGVVGASMYIMNSGNMLVTTEERPEGNGDIFTVQDMYIGVSYARRLTDRFSIGGTFKYIHQSLWQLSASTVAFDAGLQFATPLNDLSLGLSISNFGGDLRLEGSNLAVRCGRSPHEKLGSAVALPLWCGLQAFGE